MDYNCERFVSDAANNVFVAVYALMEHLSKPFYPIKVDYGRKVPKETGNCWCVERDLLILSLFRIICRSITPISKKDVRDLVLYFEVVVNIGSFIRDFIYLD